MRSAEMLGEVAWGGKITDVINRREFLSTAAWLLASNAASSSDRHRSGKPKQILVIRHAEKNGDKTDPHLNSRGYLRAAALHRLFPANFDTPDFLFASQASEHSKRPLETITPLAQALHLQINARFANEDYASLAKELLANPLYARKTVLVCWHHGKIPALASALGVLDVPSPWPDALFDRVWRIEYLNSNVRFTDLPQHLLDGDS